MNHSIEKFLQDNRFATDTVLMVLSGVSGFFTYQGAVLVLDQTSMQTGFSLSALIFSTGVSAALFLFWRYALGIVPTMRTRNTRLLGLAIIGLGGMFIVCLSSWMNVMALAGAGALEAHMRGSMKSHEAALQKAYQQAMSVASLTADLDLAAQRYGNLADRETRHGALTGVAGAGGVADSLRATQKGFADLSAMIRAHGKRYEERFIVGRTAIETMDASLSAQRPVTERLSTYTAEAAKVAKIVGELNNSELTSLIARSVRGFSGGTGLFSVSLRNRKLAAAQNDALQRIATDLADTGQRISAAAEAIGKTEPVKPPAYDRIGISTAVFIYAGELIPYWAGGVGLDLMPVVLILLLMLLYHAAVVPPPTDPDVDGMPFGQVRKVLLALEQARGGTNNPAAPQPSQLTHQALPATMPLAPQPGLSEEDEAEWSKHLNGKP